LLPGYDENNCGTATEADPVAGKKKSLIVLSLISLSHCPFSPTSKPPILESFNPLQESKRMLTQTYIKRGKTNIVCFHAASQIFD